MCVKLRPKWDVTQEVRFSSAYVDLVLHACKVYFDTVSRAYRALHGRLLDAGSSDAAIVLASCGVVSPPVSSELGTEGGVARKTVPKLERCI